MTDIMVAALNADCALLNSGIFLVITKISICLKSLTHTCIFSFSTKYLYICNLLLTIALIWLMCLNLLNSGIFFIIYKVSIYLWSFTHCIDLARVLNLLNSGTLRSDQLHKAGEFTLRVRMICWDAKDNWGWFVEMLKIIENNLLRC